MIRTDLLFITTSVSPGGHSSFLVNVDKFDEKMFDELIKCCWGATAKVYISEAREDNRGVICEGELLKTLEYGPYKK
jgi:hypothetical protein